VPGVGKTTLAKALAALVDLEFQRVQCTPDLLPADVFGFSVFNPQQGTFTFRRGPVFCNVLLVDEINRASPRTQSALLEAMGEGQVTVEGIRHYLEPPFLVLATQNPHGFHGTHPLPEAQLDRFLFQLRLGYPDAESEVEMLFAHAPGQDLDQLTPLLSKEEVLRCQELVRQVHVEPRVAEYMVAIVRRTRDDSRTRLGSSPRGSIMLFRASQAIAFLAGRTFVRPDDVRRAAPLVLAHRLVLARSAATTPETVVADALSQVEVPV
jgi:MoxR-like ATPase